MLLFHQIAENKIKMAIARGDLDNLPGQGKPLTLDDCSMVPVEMRVGFRILKNSGLVPPELTRRAEINRIERSLQGTDKSVDRQRQYLKLSLLKSGLKKR